MRRAGTLIAAKSDAFGARRSIGQQAALDIRRQGDVAAQRFLFDDPIGQPRVFDHQRELIGARAQHLFLVRAEAGALRPFPSSSTPRISLRVRSGTAKRTPAAASARISSSRSGRCAAAQSARASSSFGANGIGSG